MATDETTLERGLLSECFMGSGVLLSVDISKLNLVMFRYLVASPLSPTQTQDQEGHPSCPIHTTDLLRECSRKSMPKLKMCIQAIPFQVIMVRDDGKGAQSY